MARHLAVEKGVSLSRFLSSHLEDVVAGADEYEKARKRALARMRRGIALGVGKRPGWRRDDLHER